jgi:hypothetical protein
MRESGSEDSAMVVKPRTSVKRTVIEIDLGNRRRIRVDAHVEPRPHSHSGAPIYTVPIRSPAAAQVLRQGWKPER